VRTPVWSEFYSLGIPEVDNDHRGLFAAMGDLADAVVRQDWDSARAILQVIPPDATKHFTREERLMRRVGYSGLEWHRKQHATARKHLSILVQAALAGGIGSCGPVIAYLRSWMPAHIRLHDRMMTASVRNFRRSLPFRRAARAAAR